MTIEVLLLLFQSVLIGLHFDSKNTGRISFRGLIEELSLFSNRSYVMPKVLSSLFFFLILLDPLGTGGDKRLTLRLCVWGYRFYITPTLMECGPAEATGLGFVCFVVINPRVLSANRVYFGLLFFLFHIFFVSPPPPLKQ